jgi:phytoene dehydrogenase-like protein
MEKNYDIIIIGAGPNGLICAGYLARAGLKVVLLEARHETGGGLDTFEFAGFRHNPHAIYQMMAELMPPWKDFDLAARGVRFIRPRVQAAFVDKGRTPIILYSDPALTCKHLADNFSSADALAYERLHKDFSEYCEKILIPLTFVPPVPPVEQVQTLNNAADDVGRRFNEVAELTPTEMLDLYGLSAPLKAALLELYCMWGMSPFEALGYIFPLYVVRMTNAAIVSGGSHRLSSALHKAVVGAGGEIRDSAPVAKVLVENNRAVGVRLKSGEEIRAKAVASTVDPHQNFLEFFDSHELDSDLVEAAKRWQWEKTTLFTVHLGLEEAPKYVGSDSFPDINQALMTFMGIPEPDALVAHLESVEDGIVADPPLGHATCCSVFDPIMAPPRHSHRPL